MGRIEQHTAGAAPSRRLEFFGSGREYFGIWLANTALTIVTLGIYSAWAKVRRIRYFMGNTAVLGDRLDYHATGMMILKGRLIALAIVIAYSVLGSVSPVAQGIATLVLLPVYPWVINMSLRFGHRMTSWRTVRFNWHGTYWGVVRIYFLWPIVSVLSLGLLLPFAARASRQYLANHSTFGRTRFAASTKVGSYYLALAFTVILGIVLMVTLSTVASLFSGRFGGPLPELDLNDPGSIFDHMLPLLVSLAGVVAVFGLVSTYFQMLARNIIINALSLGDAARFGSDLNPFRYLWILVSNFVVIVCSLTLLYPWARVRSYRYQAECISVTPATEVAAFLESEAKAGGAFGEEFADFEGIDIGL